jgi:hypothetical protein
VEREGEVRSTLDNLGIKPGLSLYLKGVNITRSQGGFELNLASKWKRKYRGWTAEEGWFIMTSFESLALALIAYQKRFGIEEMFRDFKSGGYNLEDTLLVGQRLNTLILLIALAYAQATLSGEIVKQKGAGQYIARVKEQGRTRRRHSDFYLGLHAISWIESLHTFEIEMLALIDLSRSRLANYLRGMRAASLILSAC